jgi:hypothetical protein
MRPLRTHVARAGLLRPTRTSAEPISATVSKVRIHQGERSRLGSAKAPGTWSPTIHDAKTIANALAAREARTFARSAIPTVIRNAPVSRARGT